MLKRESGSRRGMQANAPGAMWYRPRQHFPEFHAAWFDHTTPALSRAVTSRGAEATKFVLISLP